MGASDLHLRSGDIPMVRVDGALVKCGTEIISEAGVQNFLCNVLSSDELATLKQRVEVDGAFTSSHGRWRFNVYHFMHGVGLSLRRLPLTVPALGQLGLPEAVGQFAHLNRGLVLITGATGSGKSTTAAALLDVINRSSESHIVTIEDPIEYVHESVRSLVSQREVGTHTKSFSQALRSALREDPDVIFVGEMRDLETVRLTLQAAETGHLVISTLHTAGAAKTVARVVDVFPAEQQAMVRMMFAEAVEGIVSQELVVCNGGGRVVVSEVLVATSSVRSLIRDGKTHQLEHVMQTSSGVGMQTREASLRSLRARGLLGSEEFAGWPSIRA
jgi:twitching motility protein PilT